MFSEQPSATRDRHTLTIRIPTTLHDTLERIAEHDCETVASIVRRMLRRGTEQAEQRHELTSHV